MVLKERWYSKKKRSNAYFSEETHLQEAEGLMSSQTNCDRRTADSIGLMSCSSNVSPNAAYLLAAALPVNVQITSKQPIPKKESISQ